MSDTMFARFYRVVLLVLMCSGMVGCVSAPVQEMSDARQAIKAARDAGADRVATQKLNEAQTLLEKAEASLQKGAYSSARRDALAARSRATEALGVAQPGEE